jgi:hypothetical protein
MTRYENRKGAKVVDLMTLQQSRSLNSVKFRFNPLRAVNGK